MSELWIVMREWDEDGLDLCEFYGTFRDGDVANLYALEKAKHKGGTFSPIPLLEPYEKCQAMCCIHPPGDGSTCAGGSCCCTEDYTCDLCKMKNPEVCTAVGDEYGNKLHNPICGCSDCVEFFKKKAEDNG